MSETAINLGIWLASDASRLVHPDRESLDVLVLHAKSIQEVVDLVSPLSRRLKGGVNAWAPSLTDKAGNEGPPPKIRYRKVEDGQWDCIVLSPYTVETCGTKMVRNDLMQALTSIKLSDRSRIVLCVPSNPETSPMSLRARVFGQSPPTTEELRGTVTEEDAFQVLESIGFGNIEAQRLDCRMDVGKFLKNLPGGVKDVSDWLRVTMDTCKRAGTHEMSQLKRLCQKGTEEVLQPKTIFNIPVPAGFEHDARAQPSPSEWWPHGDLRNFRHYGLERWNAIRQEWEQQGTGETSNKKQIVKVPKMSARELNGLVETLTTNHDRIELPHPMRLDDLLDVLVDVWDSLDDGA